MKAGELYQNFKSLEKIYKNCSNERVFKLLDNFNDVEKRYNKIIEKRNEIARKYELDPRNDPRKWPDPRKKEEPDEEEIVKYDEAIK